MTTTTLPAEVSAKHVEVTSRSGTMAYVTDEAGAQYAVSTFLCNCAEVEIGLYVTGREDTGNKQAVYTCALHGEHTASAQLCGNPAARGLSITKAQAGRIFGYTEQTTRRRVLDSGRPTWGYTK